MPLINTIFTKRNDPQPCGADGFEYLVAPSQMVLSALVGSSQGVTLANTFGTGLSNIVAALNIASAMHSPDYEPSSVFYGSGNTALRSVPTTGGTTTNRGNVLSSASENVGSGARMTHVRWSPDGTGIFVLVNMSTSAGSRPRLFKIPYPFPANPFTPAHRQQIWAGPNNTGSTGYMSFDLVNRFIFLTFSSGNGPNGLVKVAWDGSITQNLLSWSNGVTSPQPWIGGVAYVPKDDYVYYIYSPDTVDGTFGLGRIKPDGTLNEYIGDFGTVDRGSLIIQGPQIPLEYHHGADMFYTMENVEATGDLVVVNRQAQVLATLNSFGATLNDICLTAIN